MSVETLSQTSSTGASVRTSSNASSERSLDERSISSVAASNTPQPAKAGLFFFPDPLPSSARTVTTPTALESQSVRQAEGTHRVVEDDVAAELCGSPRMKKVQTAEKTRSEWIATIKKEGSYYLPLLEDESNNAKPSDLQEKLSKINRRLKSAQLDPEQSDKQSNAGFSLPAVHPAFRQKGPEKDSHEEKLLALQAEVEALAHDLRTLKRSTKSKNGRLAEDVKRLCKNQDRLLKGWEGMRNELLQVKVSQEQLMLHLNSISGSKDTSKPSSRSSRPATEVFGQPVTRPTWSIGEHADGDGLRVHTPTCNDFFQSPNDRYSQFGPSISLDSNTTPDLPFRNDRQEANGSHGARRMLTPRTREGLQMAPLPDHHAEHIRQYPQGCRWRYCSICWDGGRP